MSIKHTRDICNKEERKTVEGYKKRADPQITKNNTDNDKFKTLIDATGFK